MRQTSVLQHFQQFLFLQSELSCTIMDTKDVKSLHELIADTESWSVVDVKFDELVQIDAGDILSCFSKLTEPDLIFDIFDLVKN